MGLDAYMILADVDEAFDLGEHAFPGETIGDLVPGIGLKTIGEFHARVIEALRARGPVNEDEVWRKECSIIGDALGKDPKFIKPEHRFIEDLGLN